MATKKTHWWIRFTICKWAMASGCGIRLRRNSPSLQTCHGKYSFPPITNTPNGRWFPVYRVRGRSHACSPRRSTMAWPIGMDAVAAGEGALHTCMERGPRRRRKSSINRPSSISACARTPAYPATRSCKETSGTSFWRWPTKSLLLIERRSSFPPSTQLHAANLQNALDPNSSAESCRSKLRQ